MKRMKTVLIPSSHCMRSADKTDCVQQRKQFSERTVILHNDRSNKALKARTNHIKESVNAH